MITPKETFSIVIESPNPAELPVDYFKEIFERVERAYNLAKGRDPRGREGEARVFARVKPGSTAIEFRTVTAEGGALAIEDTPWPIIENSLRKISENGRRIGLNENEYSVVKEFSAISKNIAKDYPIKIKSGRTKTYLYLDETWRRKAEAINPIKITENEITVWGKLLEGDFRKGKYACKIVRLDGKEIQCSYPPYLEENVAEHLKPLSRDVVVKGIAIKTKGKVRKIKITEIIAQQLVFETPLPPYAYEDPREFIGVFSDEPESADELTAAMIKAAWGDE